jgi:formate-dependent nitrite reductase membrane component NrfD
MNQKINTMNVLFGFFFMGISLHYYSKIKRREVFAELSKAKEAAPMLDWLMLIISFLVFVYLGITLILPEKF